MKRKDSVILYESFFEATEDLNPMQIAEIWQALQAYIRNEDDYIFQDKIAKMAFNFIRLQLNADKKKYNDKCNARAEAGRRGGLKTAQQKQANQANDDFAKQNKQKQANQADTDTDTDNNIDIIEKEKEKEIFQNDETEAPTLEYIKRLAGSPDIMLSEEEAVKFYDHYSANGWRRSGGAEIKDIAAMMRIWKRNQAKFDNPQPNANGINKPNRAFSLEAYKEMFIQINGSQECGGIPLLSDNDEDFLKLSYEEIQKQRPKTYASLKARWDNPIDPITKKVRAKLG